MLQELRVRQLGVVEDATLELDAGMTAITGETGAGKTMVVEAIRLLTGGRSEARMVRDGAGEALIEGRFENGDVDTIIARSVARTGKSKSTIDDRMVSLATLAEVGSRLVDLYGQHAHQKLLGAAAQRDALDAFGNVELTALHKARHAIRDIDAQLEHLGGDPQTRAREMDLLRFQLTELDDAELANVDEDETLEKEGAALADAEAHRQAASSAHEIINGDGGVAEQLGVALHAVAGRPPMADIEAQLRTLIADVSEAAHDSGALADQLRDDPERLAQINDRRSLLKQLLRKYGTDLREVIAFREQTRARLVELEQHDTVVNEIQTERDKCVTRVKSEEAAVRKAREKAAPKLAGDVQAQLRKLALPNARFEIRVGESSSGDQVEFLLGPNPGMPLLPVAKAASGGELARTMLAMRLSLMNATTEPNDLVLIFDEVDAGIGGEAAVAVGRALSALARATGHQVLVVTHLPQVAAFADNQITVRKETTGVMTVAKVVSLTDAEREIELARMLSGRPDSSSGRAHARELLGLADATPKGGKVKTGKAS